MEISFGLHGFWRKLDVHVVKIQPPGSVECQAYLRMYIDLNYTWTDTTTGTDDRQLQGTAARDQRVTRTGPSAELEPRFHL